MALYEIYQRIPTDRSEIGAIRMQWVPEIDRWTVIPNSLVEVYEVYEEAKIFGIDTSGKILSLEELRSEYTRYKEFNGLALVSPEYYKVFLVGNKFVAINLQHYKIRFIQHEL